MRRAPSGFRLEIDFSLIYSFQIAIVTAYALTNYFFLLSASGISKNSSKTSPSSAAPSSLTIASYSEKSNASSLPTPRTEGEILSSPNLNPFSFNELKNATRNFRPDSLLGEGGFGYVFKGWINESTFTAAKPGSGMVVAVKKLKPEGFQGHKEWLVGFNYNYFFLVCSKSLALLIY